MPTLAQTFPTIADKLKRTDPNNKIARIIELLAEHNEVLQDAPTMMGNLTTGHRTTVRTGLPTVTWRKLYQGVQPSKSTTRQVDDSCGMLEAYSEVDKALYMLNSDGAAFRLSEARAFLEAMSQEMVATLFYGDNELNPEKFLGLTERYSDPSAENGGNIINGGGTSGNQTSMWLVTWGEQTAHLITPKGSPTGLQREDLGEQTKEKADGSMYQVLREHFRWDLGFTLRDWRETVRIANLDVAAITAYNTAPDDAPDLIELMIDAHNARYSGSVGTSVWYANRKVKTVLDKLAMNKANVNLTIENFGGKPVTMFWGIPIRRVDAITNTESVVSFA